MALIECDFYSKVLGISTSMYVILPSLRNMEESPPLAGYRRRYPTLTLLHGLSDDHTIWVRRTAIERYVSSLPLAVIMPAVHRSFYTDTASGQKYWTFVSQELPAVARSYFPLAADRESNYVAGLSMGGYGAFKLALSHPERYSAAASLSGSLDIARRLPQIEDSEWRQELEAIFGDLENVAGSDNDLFYLAEKLARSASEAPSLYACCGTKDFLRDSNLRFRELAKSLELPLTYEEGPGEHEWGYWDRQIQRVLAWLPIGKTQGQHPEDKGKR